jgi:hypothetical protein
MIRPLPSLWIAFAGAIILLSATCAAQQTRREPRIGYAFPAGGQQGTAVEVAVGGQFLRDPKSALISGQGVSAQVTGYVGQYRPVNRPEMNELRRRIDARRAGKPIDTTHDKITTGGPNASPQKSDENNVVDHQLLIDVVKMNLQELAQVEKLFFRVMRKQQPNAQIGETVLLKLTIDASAPVGKRELRLQSAAGVTNPIFIEVGELPEFAESEPNDGAALGTAIPSTPALLNGQVMPGDVDRFRFTATKGQKLVVAAHARSLVPYSCRRRARMVPGDGRSLRFRRTRSRLRR